MTKLIKTSSGSNGTKTSTMSGEGEDADVVAATKQSVAELEPPDDATEMRVGAWRKWQGFFLETLDLTKLGIDVFSFDTFSGAEDHLAPVVERPCICAQESSEGSAACDHLPRVG